MKEFRPWIVPAIVDVDGRWQSDERSLQKDAAVESTITSAVDESWFRYIGWFWLLIIAGLFLFGAIQTVTDQPGVLHTWNGLATALLALTNAGWFLYMMSLRRKRRFARGAPLDRRLAFALVGVGIALTVPLVLLHREFGGVAFADMGIFAFALGGWVGMVPGVLLGGLFLYVDGALSSITFPRTGSDVLSVVSTIGITYSVSTLIRQRTERDRLIVELREANGQLQHAHQQLRLAHAREIELAALRERNRLARDMHDSLGHALVLIAVKIEAGQRLQTVDPARATAEWEETKTLVRSTMADLRHSIAGLRLPALQEQPFREALMELGFELERVVGVAVTIDAPGEVDLLDRPIHEALYRVVQEALANVARHAGARHATVRLERHGHAVRLEIADDGIGLAAAPRSEGGHYGVTGMRERVEALGGTLTLGPREVAGQPVSNRGTVVRATIPVKEHSGAGHPHPVG